MSHEMTNENETFCGCTSTMSPTMSLAMNPTISLASFCVLVCTIQHFRRTLVTRAYTWVRAGGSLWLHYRRITSTFLLIANPLVDPSESLRPTVGDLSSRAL